MKYIDLAAMDSRQRAEMMAVLSGPHYLREQLPLAEEGIEHLDGFADDDLGVLHPLLDAPHTVGAGDLVDPFGYVELDVPAHIYSIVRVGYGSRFGDHDRDFQLLVVPNERLELVAYSYSFGVEDPGRKLNVYLDYAPDEAVASPMAVEAGKLVNPPQGASGVATSRVVGLRCFDALARPVTKPLHFELTGEALSGGEGGVVDAARVLRRVELGVVDDDLVHQSVEGRAQQVQPFTKEHREVGWEWLGCVQVQGVPVSVVFDPALNRMGLYVFGRYPPHFFSHYGGSLQSSYEQPEIVIHKSQV